MKKPTKTQIEKALKKTNGNKTEAAALLGIDRWKFWKLSKNIEVEDETESQRTIRKTESKLRKTQDELKGEKRRREVAEHDLEKAIERDGVLTELNERQPAVRQLSALKKKSRTKGGCTAIICATDWHLEKRITPSTVSGLNEFDLDIAARRIKRFWEKSLYLTEFFRHIADVDEIVVWFGGDLINNHLHPEDVEGNFCGPIEAIGLCQDYMAEGLDLLGSKGKAPVRVVANYGNHARTTKKVRHATGWQHSWEYLAYTNLAKTCKRLPLQIAQGYMNYTPVQGHNVRFHHGEAIRYAGGVGGLTIPLGKSIAQWDKARRADLSINGHFHTMQDNWNWHSCGCLCGYDSFAQSIKADFQEPTQSVVFVDKTRGKVAALPIFVEKPTQ
jgi:hypothetical protein